MTDPFIIHEYFQLLGNTLADLNLFDRPDLIWNLDETSLCLDPSKTKVVGAVNKPCCSATFGSGKENITVLAAANAAGQKIAPLIVFKGQYVWKQWTTDKKDYEFELTYASSSKGWMEGTIFVNYLKKALFPALGEERPVLIIYDGHSSHVTVDVVQLAIRHGITILKLPPHTSHLLQPLDVAVFRSFKCKWDAKLVIWQRHNVGLKMPKNVFSQTFADTWQETNAEIIKSGFKKTGIYPFNPDVLTQDIFEPAAYKRFKEKLRTNALKNPKPLQNLCIDVFNKILQFAPDLEEQVERVVTHTNTQNVTFLSDLSRKDNQTQSFLANNISSLPDCLKCKQNVKPEPKIKILSNVKVNFQELLLDKIKQDKKDINYQTKKTRVAKGAEIITSKQLEDLEKQSNETALQKAKPKKRKSIKDIDFADVGPSGIKKVSKQKKQGKKKHKKEIDSNESSSDISDFISLYSDDIDIDQYYNDETLREENWPDDLNFEMDTLNSLETYENKEISNEVKECENGNPHTKTKNKSVGKKSKAKENNQGSKETNESDDDSSVVGNINKNLTNTTEIETLQENYCVNDSVLVRYYVRKTWKYYIGFIKGIKEKDGNRLYCIAYLKTMKAPQLCFRETKKLDYDEITNISIVKKINLHRMNDKMYRLVNESDNIYF
ncbi:unnamed protein product [Parnassius apollo]|uniref:(apollo) hypothetical protein n=1 Tax=Parnassius apollo TaxID=110799 RepID=A0A8S3WDR8_PARAO|nr:unnamed protein product [Parnassius apollo]